MTLLQIVPVSNSGKVRLVFSDGQVLKTQGYVAAELGLSVGMELSEDGWQQLQKTVGKVSAKERAVRIVSASGVSERELQKRLEQKGEDGQDAAEAVSWLKELHLLDDRETAAQLVASAVRRGYGKSRIQSLLYEKGIPKAYWQEALSGIPDQSDAIDQFLAKRFAGQEPDEKTVKKAVDALLRRGHSWGDIQNALRRYQTELEEVPDFDPEF